MRLNELYTAFQGEGPRLGIEAVFIRLHGCPVQCAWCDTAFTWDGSETGERLTPVEIGRRALELAAEKSIRHFVITGGEPAIYKDLGDLVATLLAPASPASLKRHTVEIETSAALPPPSGLDGPHTCANLSPKLPSALAHLQPDPAILRAWNDAMHCDLKLVIAGELDWLAMVELLELLPSDMRERTWLMPEGRTRDELASSQAWLLDRASGTGLKVTTRMHVLAHDAKRGV